jgi:MYXO-CTERM domain-containing protein
VNPCDGIDCGKGFVCEAGACVVACTCGGCDTGECDAKSGHCVDQGCGAVSCDTGQHCAAGACVDDCADAKCPGGADCHDGKCDPPASGNQDMIGATGGAPDGPGISLGGTGIDVTPGSTAGTESGGTAAGTTNSDGTSGSNAATPTLKDPGCACRQGHAVGDPRFAALGLLALGLLAARKRERSGSAP